LNFSLEKASIFPDFHMNFFILEGCNENEKTIFLDGGTWSDRTSGCSCKKKKKIAKRGHDRMAQLTAGADEKRVSEKQGEEKRDVA